MKILGIHGAFSSPNSLNYIREKSNKEWIMVDYSKKQNGIKNIIDEIDENLTDDVFIVGHSLGGVIGCNLLHNKNVKGILTIASPLNGIRFPYFSNFFITKKTFVDEISTTTKFMRETKNNILIHESMITSIITNRGHPLFFLEPNDGILTVRNQDYGNHSKYFIEATHSEILQMDETVKIMVDSMQNL